MNNSIEQRRQITPLLSDEWIVFNTRNRPATRGRIALYAQAMKDGGWRYNADPIRFSGSWKIGKHDLISPGDAVLLDGQKRLMAVKASGVTIEALVVFGLEQQVFSTIDIGEARSYGATLATLGYKNSHCLSAMASMVWRYDNVLAVGNKQKTRDAGYTRDSMIQFVAENQKLAVSATFGTALSKHLQSWLPPAQVGFLHFIFNRLSEEDAAEYFMQLKTGVNLNEKSPLLHLRNRLQGNACAKAKLPAEVLLALSIKAWNSFRRREPMGVLRWRQDGPDAEDFPVAI